MHPAYSIILFTTSSGAGCGLLALLALHVLGGGTGSLSFRIAAVALAFALITIGLVSSTFHLGHPERAWRAFSQWRTSWLSREGVAAVATYAVGGAFALLWIAGGAETAALRLFAALTVLSCGATIVCTAMIYASLPTVRKWYHPLVAPAYLALALATGSCLLVALTHLLGRPTVAEGAVAAGCCILAIMVKLAYWRSIDADSGRFTVGQATGLGALGPVRQWEAPHTADSFVMREMGYSVARKHVARLRMLVLSTLALAALAAAVAAGASGLSTAAALASAALAILGTATERWLFFAEAQHVVSLFYGAEHA